MNEFKEKFSSTDINLNKSPNNQISNQESRKESSPSKYDSLQKELNKKLINLLNQQKKDETNILLTDEKNSNKISLKDYQEQIKGKLAPNSEKSIPLPTKDSIIRNQGFISTNSKNKHKIKKYTYYFVQNLIEYI